MTTIHASRRAVIGALATLPALAIPAAALATTVDRTTWEQALARYEKAQRQLSALPADAADTVTNPMMDELITAQDLVTELPAPDLKAVEWKLRYWRGEAEYAVIAPEYYDAMIADVRRLGGVS